MGALVGGPIVIADDHGGWAGERPTDIVYNPSSSQFLVVWRNLRTGWWNTWVRHVSTVGAMGPEIQVTSIDTAHETWAQAAYNPQYDEYLLVWDYRNAADGPSDLRGKRLTGAGQPFGVMLYLITGSADQRFSDLVYREDLERYVLVWEDDGDGDYDIYGQLLTPEATLDGGSYPVSDEPQDENRLGVALGGAGEALVVWERNNGGSAAHDLYGRRLGADAQPAGAGFVIMEWDGEQRVPCVAGDGQGRYMVVWRDNRSGDWDVYALLVQPSTGVSSAVIVSDRVPLHAERGEARQR